MALDLVQSKAVQHVNGAAMILAGPGSGKTTVITHRIQNLIEKNHINESKILVITFTKMAAKEMEERFLKLCNKSHSGVVFGTFHAIFFMILKNVFHYSAKDIIKEKEQWRFIKNQLSFHTVQVQDETSLIVDILSEISKVKAKKIDITTYASLSCDKNLFYCLYNEYQNMLRQEHKIDFEDMMITTLEVLKNRKDILSYWQNKYDYILIDEFQDAAPVQFQIINLLCKIHQNIFIVGDDDQSIYGFRGAAPSVMKDFVKLYPEASIYKLNINYRSNRYIVEMATNLINHNQDRFYKDLQAFNKYNNKVDIRGFEDITKQNQYILELIYQQKEIAILTRTNSGAANTIKILERQGICVKAAAGKEDLSKHWITLDIAAYISIANGSRERCDYLRVINKPYRYISRDYFTSNTVHLEEIKNNMRQGQHHSEFKEFNLFLENIKLMSNMTTYAKVNYIRKRIHYDRYIQDYCMEQNIDSKPLINILDKIQECAKKSNSYNDWLQRISINKEGDKKALYSDTKYNIQVCTMHSCKGLEFDNVLLMDVNEGIIPYSKVDTKEGLEEERRLFYVAVTRAKQRLFICYLKKRHDKALQPSRFIKELYNSP